MSSYTFFKFIKSFKFCFKVLTNCIEWIAYEIISCRKLVIIITSFFKQNYSLCIFCSLFSTSQNSFLHFFLIARSSSLHNRGPYHQHQNNQVLIHIFARDSALITINFFSFFETLKSICSSLILWYRQFRAGQFFIASLDYFP